MDGQKKKSWGICVCHIQSLSPGRLFVGGPLSSCPHIPGSHIFGVRLDRLILSLFGFKKKRQQQLLFNAFFFALQWQARDDDTMKFENIYFLTETVATVQQPHVLVLFRYTASVCTFIVLRNVITLQLRSNCVELAIDKPNHQFSCFYRQC